MFIDVKSFDEANEEMDDELTETVKEIVSEKGEALSKESDLEIKKSDEFFLFHSKMEL